QRQPEPADAEAERERHQPGEAEPADVKAEEDRDQGEARVARAPERAAEREVERHERLAGGEHANEGDRVGDDGGVIDEETGDRPRRREDQDAGRGHEPHGEPDGCPAAPFGVVGAPRAQALSDHRCRGGREAEAREEGEREDADADEVRGDGRRSVVRGEHDVEEEADLHEQVLDRRGVADAEHPPDHVGSKPQRVRAEREHEPAPREKREAEARARGEGDGGQTRTGRIIRTATATAVSSDWRSVSSAAPRSPAPTWRATIASAPVPRANITASTAPRIWTPTPTPATAVRPSRPTISMSQRPTNDSME